MDIFGLLSTETFRKSLTWLRLYSVLFETRTLIHTRSRYSLEGRSDHAEPTVQHHTGISIAFDTPKFDNH